MACSDSCCPYCGHSRSPAARQRCTASAWYKSRAGWMRALHAHRSRQRILEHLHRQRHVAGRVQGRDLVLGGRPYRHPGRAVRRSVQGNPPPGADNSRLPPATPLRFDGKVRTGGSVGPYSTTAARWLRPAAANAVGVAAAPNASGAAWIA